MPAALVSTFVTGLGTGALTLVLVLLVLDRTGSFGSAGAVSAAYLLGAGAFGPVRGRLMDRLGPSPVLLAVAAVHGTGLAIFLVLTIEEASSAALVTAAALAGSSAPTVGPALRLLWPDLLGDEREVGYAVQTVLSEAFLLIGPLIAAALAGLGDPLLALVIVAVANVSGTVSFAAMGASRRWRPSESVHRTRAGALRRAGVRTMVAVALPLGGAIGVIELAAPAVAREHGDAALGGVALAALAAASLVGGLLYGARTWPGSAATRYIALTAALVVLLLPLPLADSFATFVALMALSGLAWAPLSATAFALYDDVADAGTMAEAVTWNGAMLLLGMAAGTSIGGRLIETAGPSQALWTAPCLAAVGLLVATLNRASLTRSADGVGVPRKRGPDGSWPARCA